MRDSIKEACEEGMKVGRGTEEFEAYCLNKRVDPETLRGLSIWDGWQARQPEIDALKAEWEMCISLWHETGRENAALKAEVERLRKDAELYRQQYLHQVYKPQ